MDKHLFNYKLTLYHQEVIYKSSGLLTKNQSLLFISFLIQILAYNIYLHLFCE